MTLAEYLDAAKLSRLDLARRLGVTDSAVSRWATGERCPSVTFAFAIERETGGAVPAASWQMVTARRRDRKPPAKVARRLVRRAGRRAPQRLPQSSK